MLKLSLKNKDFMLNSFKKWTFWCIVCKFGANAHFPLQIWVLILIFMVSMKRAKRIFSPICYLQVAATINKFTFSNQNNNNNKKFTKNLFCEWAKDNGVWWWKQRKQRINFIFWYNKSKTERPFDNMSMLKTSFFPRINPRTYKQN